MPHCATPAVSQRPRHRRDRVRPARAHVRLPINDDEIVDRALAIQASVGRDITLVTYDTKMRLRARTAGPTVKKLDQDPEPNAQRGS